MCGICGVVSTDRSEVIDPRVISQMRDTLIHRGPDDKGIYVRPGIGLGHRRLSIIDLRPEGRQPMGNEDGTVQIVFNGEIYNFAEHYEWLLARGHRFRSRSDTEVIIHLYEELGTGCLERLRGMFAFGIWDARKRLLFLARDRFGKKPLFYHFDGKRLLFASQPKAILAYPGVSRDPDPDAIDSYLSLGYVPGPLSAIRGIRKLQPAHYLTFAEGQLTIRRYWRLRYLPKLEISENEACDQIIERLTEATKLRMISDVPLGAFLSGGIDSSAVVGLMAKLSTTPIKTFSIGFDEPRYDESYYAKMIAREFGTEHHQFTIRPDATDLLEKLVWHYDDPYADSSALPTYYLCKLAREYVTVALNGDAGDENFGGYKRYTLNVLAHYLRDHPAIRRVAGYATEGGAKLFSNNVSVSHKLRTLNAVLTMEPRLWNAKLLMQFSSAIKRQLYTRDFADSVNCGAAEEMILALYNETDADNYLDSALSVDFNLYLPDDLMVKVDVASMAFGLEARSPMMDHEFVEFVARLPAHFKVSGLTTKSILKKSLRGFLPDAILKRSKKGFSVPLERWFRGRLRDLLGDVLLSRSFLERGYFERTAVEGLIDAHLTGRANQQARLWTLLMLELWHRVHIDAPSSFATDSAGAAVAAVL